ncbi:MAG TPA: twin-arginine translocase TatA/TatE family subunit [Gammaproteobacteria bacterium]|nr:twin-arginine translocase TatA/TatE family subunit [Gammaproteobacteria bacterium]
MLDGISIWQLLIILAIVALVFGTKRLRNIGGDMGSALRSFRSAFRGDDETEGKESSGGIDPEKLTRFDDNEREPAGTEHAAHGRGER